jgi:hypothetical protein
MIADGLPKKALPKCRRQGKKEIAAGETIFAKPGI